MARIFRVHPAVGVARVGNANRDTFFVGPETPGVPTNFDLAHGAFRPFKDAGLVKPQAAQFRVWEYEQLADGTLRPLREAVLGQEGVAQIEWTVHVANRKAAFFEFHGQQGATDDFAGNKRRNAAVTDPAERERRLVIDPGSCVISTAKQGPVLLANTSADTRDGIPDLGELRIDNDGRLQVIGGRGSTLQQGADIGNYVNNDGWFDDVADGPIAARITVQGPSGPELIDADGAWVVVGPPDFAPAVGHVVSLYETMWDLAVRELSALPKLAAFADGGPLEALRRQREDWAKTRNSFTDYEPSFATEVAPLLDRALKQVFVHLPSPATPFHTTFDPVMWKALVSDDKVRREVFDRLRDPDGTNPSADLMPKGLGDEYVDESQTGENDPVRLNVRRFFSLTRTQYALMRQWALGKFKRDGDTPPALPTAEAITPEGMDRAALENCVGGPFYPGIEVSWLVRRATIYSEPFRLRLGGGAGPVQVGPGFLTQQMALPWQADFRDCKRETLTDPATGKTTSAMWWAAQRPDDVRPESDPTTQVPWTRPPFFNAGDDDDARYVEMKTNWFKQGFVAKLVGSVFVETERG